MFSTAWGLNCTSQVVSSTTSFFNIQVIAEACNENDVGIVKINDAEEAEEFGLGELPAVVLFQNKLPTVFTGNVEDQDEVLVRT